MLPGLVFSAPVGRRLGVVQSIGELIRRSGLVAIIRNEGALDVLLEVGDALLASPLPVLAISTRSREPWAAIAELRARGGRNLLVGAAYFAGYAPPATGPGSPLTLALDAGAQFVLGGCFSPEAAQFCQAHGCAYLPRANDVDTLAQAAASGCPAVTVFPASRGGLARCRILVTAAATLPAHPAVLAVGGITPDAVPAFARAGATAAGIYGVLGTGAAWRMPELIRRVRRLRAAWWTTDETGRA